MKLYILFVITEIIFFPGIQGKNCYSCSGSVSYNSGRRCAANGTAISTTYCRSSYYCLTRAYYSNGVLSSVSRRCQSPYSDHDSSTTRPPTTNTCYSSYSSYSTVPSLTCYYPCSTTRCNTISAKLPGASTSYTSRPSTCPASCPDECNSYGQCIQSSLRCIQCNSDFDPNCANKTLPTPCKRTSQNYCAISKVTTLNATAGTFLRTTVTKSCITVSTSSPPLGKCGLTVRSSSYNLPVTVNYACSYYCNTHGCNVDTPERSTINDKPALSCVVCAQKGNSGTSCSTKTSLTRCPPSARYCKTTVQYYISKNSVGQGVVQSRVAYVTRECATDPVENKCTTFTAIGTDLEGITCQETCQTQGCNIGWPGRPLCSQCNSKNSRYNQNAFEQCFKTPPAARACPSPAYTYCRKTIENIGNVEGYNREVIRECAYENNGTSCSTVNVGGQILRNCQTSCNTHGCNLGQTAGFSPLKPSLIMFVTLAIFALI